MMSIIVPGIIFWGLFGAVMGSFLNVCADRLPLRQSLIRPSSRCPACETRLAIWDLVPVISYVRLRGRCRHCGAAIPWRIVAIEIGTGAVFAGLFWHYGLTVELGVLLFYTCLMLLIMVIDLEHHLILNRVVYPAMAAALLISYLSSNPGLISSLIGGAAGFLILFLVALAFHGGMGWGDVKMAGLMGLVLGWPNILLALFLAVVAGGLVAVVLWVARLRRRRQAIPFGPFLALATLTSLVWGQPILDFYRNLF